MKESERQFRYIFIETDNFSNKGGHISESQRQRLYFDLMLGNSELMPNTGGLKKIVCGVGGVYAKDGLHVVLAEYAYPDVGARFFLLLAKFSEKVTKDLSVSQEKELRKLKQKADYYIGQRYEELLNESF
jgi:hypothetical protein